MKPAFKLPNRTVDEWVAGSAERPLPPPASIEQPVGAPQPPKLKPARLTIDLDPGLHARFKAACALNTTDMVTEVRQFIENWTAAHRS